MSSPASVCITPSKICSRRLFSISNAPVKFSLRKSNGNSWSPVVTEEWTCSTKLLKFTRRSMKKIKTTLIACVDLCQSDVSSAWSTTSSRRNWPCSIVKRKPSASTSTPRTSNIVREWVVAVHNNNNLSLVQHQLPRLVRCLIWTTCQDLKSTNVVWVARLLRMRKRMSGTPRDSLSDHYESQLLTFHAKTCHRISINLICPCPEVCNLC